MRQNLFIIPDELFGQPVFGVGLLLMVWSVLSVGWIVWTGKKLGWNEAIKELLPFTLVTAFLIVVVLPRLEIKGPNGVPLGLPIRGYGTMMLCGVMSGWGLSIWRAPRFGIHRDTIISLGWRLIFAGIIGARLFFVIEYWHEFQRPTVLETLLQIVKFTEGGLVVYGSMIGGFCAFVWFLKQRQIPMLKLGDVVAPGVVLGMAIGRIGCVMNGCCYGGECHLEKGCVQFPKYSSREQQVLSPPYRHQLATGRLHGFIMAANPAGQPIVRSVDPRSAAENGGLIAGVRIAQINGISTEKIDVAEEVLLHSGPDISITLADGQRLKWTIGSLPARSRPVHPSQFYAAISGFLICFLLLSIEPFFARHGALMATLLTLYPVVRFFEEIIRDDEPAQWGTALTISQLISVVVLIGGMVTWYFVFRKEIGERHPTAKSVAA